ncbi:uncharacterized protein LOC135491179 [Lineus longissimus]|uniref:uncharacterized protein LOC135491179 n=1 Tax=Lineus longissimus TaxID=88925 RepID=UPI00315C87DE
MPAAVSEYERIRLKNIEDNKRILAELGLMNPFGPLPKIIKKTVKRSRPSSATPPAAKKRRVDEEDANKSYGSVHGSRRKSARFQGKEPKSPSEMKDDIENEEEDEDYKPRLRVPAGRENVFGAILGIEIGTTWEMRLECCVAGVHRPTVSGIHGGPDGAYSIALSGGYEDDIDMGEFFTYTGQGGRDLRGTSAKPKNLRTAPQSKDQVLAHGNLALSKNVDNGHPVRVIRGYKSRSRYAPDWGYRYDGLYSVEKAWFTTGLSGFGVWKFALRRLKDQAPPPWEYDEKTKEEMCSQDSGVVSDKSDAGSETPDPPSQESEKILAQDGDDAASVTSNGSDKETGTTKAQEHDGETDDTSKQCENQLENEDEVEDQKSMLPDDGKQSNDEKNAATEDDDSESKEKSSEDEVPMDESNSNAEERETEDDVAKDSKIEEIELNNNEGKVKDLNSFEKSAVDGTAE